MSIFKYISSCIDGEIISFTKKLQSKRGLQFAPNGTAQGFFYRAGMSGIGDSSSPEATLAMILKENSKISRYPLETRISVIESRILGNKYVQPEWIDSLPKWLAWRLPLKFPNHGINDNNGWTIVFFEWAVAHAKELF